MKGICALSGEVANLQLSHIYPKFAVKYLRNTSNDGRLRSYKNVNILRQDGLKMHLLSKASEQRFSAAETWFANHLFHPVTKTELKSFSYDDHLYYFILSLLWRALKVEIQSGTYVNEGYYQQLLACEKQWRSFLNDGYIPYQFRDVFMMITHPGHLDIPTLAGTQYYLLRNLDLTIITNKRNYVYVYAKLPRFLFWAPIFTHHFSDASFINMQGGNFNSLDLPTDPVINGFIPNRIEEINRLNTQLSPQQEEATLSKILKDQDGFLASEAGRLMQSRR
jgi:hypothetical protein